MSNPIDELLTHDKTAGVRDFLGGAFRGAVSLSDKVQPAARNWSGPLRQGAEESFRHGANVGKVMQGGALATAGGMAFSGVGLAAKKIYQAATTRGEYKEMMDLDPELHEVRKQNPKTFNAAYSAFRTINPAFAREPMVAGAHMKQFMDNPETAGLMVASTVRQPSAPGDNSGLSMETGAGPFKYKQGF